MKKTILYELSQDIIRTIIHRAFQDGQDWAEVYISWFTPNKEAHEKRIKNSTNRILRGISGLKSQD